MVKAETPEEWDKKAKEHNENERKMSNLQLLLSYTTENSTHCPYCRGEMDRAALLEEFFKLGKQDNELMGYQTHVSYGDRKF